ncbi:lipase [Actinoallomurus bryophytorum]|uniref:Platelet-activating factor acetylhydrolase isoform II n=1 Tax=Actinoallomurus bryophytorum TaxID=1490222 RepID=A0A543CP87_9ACTN|nr:hydrolase [Actinoallomurus bryophytorum]TQL98757.1 platelet-activating factor acetylhydrolase isoform II [Actinoallomurus bryophytorum]
MRKSRVTRLLIGGLITGALVTAGPAVSSAVTPKTGAPGLTRLVLPAPSGPYAVGTVALRLVDHSRPDPWVPAQPYRELMVSAFYPASDAGAYPVAPQMSPAAAKHFDESLGTPVHEGWGIPPGKVPWGATLTHSHANAPVQAGRHPVVLYSPGLGDPRTLGTTLAEDLASRGYVVVTIDHTYDASEVEFPGGRVEPFKVPVDGDILSTLKKLVSVRVADTRFVLDRLPTLPNGLGAALDPGKIGMFGQSAGGFTALQTMHDDPRVAAAADLDGTLGFDQDDGGPGLSPLAEDGLRRPFLLMGSQASDHHTVRSWEALWSNSDGPKLDLHLRGSKHHSYTDMESLVPQLSKIGLPSEAAYEDIGWIDPARAVATERAYLAAFFDRHLRGRDDGLLDGPSPRYPEVSFVR